MPFCLAEVIYSICLCLSIKTYGYLPLFRHTMIIYWFVLYPYLLTAGKHSSFVQTKLLLSSLLWIRQTHHNGSVQLIMHGIIIIFPFISISSAGQALSLSKNRNRGQEYETYVLIITPTWFGQNQYFFNIRLTIHYKWITLDMILGVYKASTFVIPRD